MGLTRPHRLPDFLVLDMHTLYSVMLNLLMDLRNEIKSLLCYLESCLSKVSGRVGLNYFSFAFLIFLRSLMNRLLIDLVIKDVGGGTVPSSPNGEEEEEDMSKITPAWWTVRFSSVRIFYFQYQAPSEP